MKRSCVIDLNTVAAVTIRKYYGSIDHEEIRDNNIDEFLKRIELQFEFANRKKEPVVLPFYDCNKDAQIDRAMRERNAENWKMILSKMSGQKQQQKL